MAKAIITILGMINNDKATYELKHKKFQAINTLSLLISNYVDEYEIRTISTKEALDVQKQVLKRENIDEHLLDQNVLLDQDEDYDVVFKKINGLLTMYDEVIIDVSHGFRHLPILMIINLIVENIINPDKIKSIYFAKEVSPHTTYEIIDLVEYLDISIIAFTLARFSENYTVSNNVKLHNKEYQQLLNNLSKFSHNILANSFKNLLEPSSMTKRSLIEETIKSIDDLQRNNKHIGNLEQYLKKVKEHLAEMQSFQKLNEYEKLYNFSKIMLDKWYLLNAITLLNEAVGLYCMHAFCKFDKSIDMHFKQFIAKDKQGLYIASNESSSILKHTFNFDHMKAKMIRESDSKIIEEKLNLIKKGKDLSYENFIKLVINISNLRNNLAHGNSGEVLTTVQGEIKKYLQQFNALCLEKNILAEYTGVLPQEVVKKPLKDKVPYITKSGIKKKI